MVLINFRITEKEKIRFKCACERLGIGMTEVFKEAIRKTISKSRGAGSYEESGVINPGFKNKK